MAPKNHLSQYPHPWRVFFNVLKRKNPTNSRRRASLVLKAHDTKPGLNTYPNCSFSLSQEWNFKLINLKFPDHSSEVICLIRPPKGRYPCLKQSTLNLVHTLPAYKILPFCTMDPLEHSSSC